MKTKEERESNSRKRQNTSKKTAVWEQKIKDLEPHPERKAELDFAEAELKKCQATMKTLNTGQHKQRAWVSGN